MSALDDARARLAAKPLLAGASPEAGAWRDNVVALVAECERLEDALREIAGLSPAAWPTGLRPILYRALDREDV